MMRATAILFLGTVAALTDIEHKPFMRKNIGRSRKINDVNRN